MSGRDPTRSFCPGRSNAFDRLLAEPRLSPQPYAPLAETWGRGRRKGGRGRVLEYGEPGKMADAQPSSYRCSDPAGSAPGSPSPGAGRQRSPAGRCAAAEEGGGGSWRGSGPSSRAYVMDGEGRGGTICNLARLHDRSGGRGEGGGQGDRHLP